MADVDLGALLTFHAAARRPATMTVVRPELPVRRRRADGDGIVRGFIEKPRSEHWINGGFFCFEPAVLELLAPTGARARAAERLAADGELRAYRHEGFWDCMDTYKDAVTLNDLWARGPRPWKLWRREPELATALRCWSPGAHGLLGGWLVAALLDAGRAGGRDPPRRARRARRSTCSVSPIGSTPSTATSATRA